MRRSSVVALALLGFGCHASPSHRPDVSPSQRGGASVRPERVLLTYARHLREGRVAEAYALTSRAYRAQHDLTSFALAAARQPILDNAGLRVGETTTVVELAVPGARTVRLVGTSPDALHLDEDPLDLYDTRSPEATLRSFVRAVRHARHAKLVELLGLSLRDELQLNGQAVPIPERLVRLANALDGELNRAPGLRVALLTETESHARVELTSGEVLSLKLTPQGWRLSDLP